MYNAYIMCIMFVLFKKLTKFIVMDFFVIVPRTVGMLHCWFVAFRMCSYFVHLLLKWPMIIMS